MIVKSFELENNIKMEEMTLSEMDNIWDQAKKNHV